MRLRRTLSAKHARRRLLPPMRLELVLDSMGDAIILTDAEDRIVFFNQAAELLTAWPQATVLGRPCGEVFAGSPVIVATIHRARLSGQTQSCGQETLRLPRRSVLIRLSCSPVWEPTGTVEGVAAILHDLSYQKKLEDQVRRNETLARLGGLIAELAHEIKNPLGGIRGAAQLLEKRLTDDPAGTECTGVMIREIDRLSRLVDQLLILGNPVTPTPTELNVHRVLHEVLSVMESELRAKRVSVRLAIDPSLPNVHGDEALLTHVFLNLVKNAMEMMPTDGRLTISTRMETDFHALSRMKGGGKFMRVEFADNGPGFSEDILDRVFEPFFTTKPRGSGLGLAICQRIVAMHGGTIQADNTPDRGGVVTVTLPLVPS
jgi:two-component system nitrogen regulation sensor histidine kinase GlnL